METVLSAFFGSIGIWPNHHVTLEMEAKAREVLEFFEVAHLADRLTVDMPITRAVCRVLEDPRQARAVVQELLAREQKTEY